MEHDQPRYLDSTHLLDIGRPRPDRPEAYHHFIYPELHPGDRLIALFSCATPPVCPPSPRSWFTRRR